MEPTTTTTTTTTSKDMPESLVLSDILTVPEPPSSAVINPHDIQLQPFCTQASQDQEFASRYPASAPDNILPSAGALQTDVERECLEELRRHEQREPSPAQQEQQPPPQHIPQPSHHAPPPPAAQQQHLPQLHERTPTPPTTSPEPSPHHTHHFSTDHMGIHQQHTGVDGRRHYSVKKVEHQNSRANRRGPMDEMRQLVRILVKLMPNSLPYLKVDEAGGGNRVTEDDIKSYISAVLGEAPQPVWGLPDGWGAYLSDLFSWACSRHVGRDEAMRCAKRLPGRSWEAVDDELARLGLCPSQWPLPLTLKGVKEANASVGGLQPPPAVAAVPAPAAAGIAPFSIAAARPLIEAHKAPQEEHPAAPKKKKARLSVQEQVLPLVSHATEKECWYLAMLFLQEATAKAGTTPARLAMELDTYQSGVRKIVEGVPRASSGPLHLNHPVGLQATRQLLGSFPNEGTEAQVFHTHSLAIPGITDHFYLPSNSTIVPVPVTSLGVGQLGMQNASGLPRIPNLQSLHRLTTTGATGGLGASEPAAANEPGPAEANPAKPLRPMPRSVQQLGMQAAAYQLMPSTSGSEPSLGGKGLIDSQKFLGGNGFAPYLGAAKSSAAEQPAALQQAVEQLTWPPRGVLGEHGEGGGPGGERLPENPRERLRGMLAQIQTTAVNRQMSQGTAALEALGLMRPSGGQSQGDVGCTEQPGARASGAMPAAAV